MRDHWTARAFDKPCPSSPRKYLGQADDGYLYLPSRRDAERWDRRFRPWNPFHWSYWLRARLRNRLVWLETFS